MLQVIRVVHQPNISPSLSQQTSCARQRKDNCKDVDGHDLTIRRSQRDGGSSRLNCNCGNPCALDQSTRWMTMGLWLVGFCRVPITPDGKRPGFRLLSSDSLRAKRNWYGSWA
jgi:hypothetical protein